MEQWCSSGKKTTCQGPAEKKGMRGGEEPGVAVMSCGDEVPTASLAVLEGT